MQDLVAKSDLVLIAKRGSGAFGNRKGSFGNQYKQWPEMIELKVLEILKGNGEIEVDDEIEVQSWYGICPYGVQMERYETAVVFLNKAKNQGWWFFSNTVYEAATYAASLCNDEAMTLKGRNLLIWDPVIRKQVKYPLTEFRRVFIHSQSPTPQ
jgi:hypothetical protein